MTDVLDAVSVSPERSLIAGYLDEQGSLTAVEKFAQRHVESVEPLQARFYRDLVPLSAPGPGQQYAFEVDLDRCSGCKACVTACHELNGLDEDETWRSVGLLQGGTSALPVLQHVTSACHHCLDPACLNGCPVNAYEKDPVTGIVKHLDDQCIGCQYCIFMCPYDVPKYNAKKGIVRKCDMCSDRLGSGEAPACVQACPTTAIRIAIVDRRTVVEDCEANQFLPGAPEPRTTLPTTAYRTTRALPRNLLPADYYTVTPGHAHFALVWMLVLTQMSVGTFVVDLLLEAIGDGRFLIGLKSFRAIAGLMVGLVGLGAAVGHLGRPLYAFRAILGLRRSWLSREILAFGVFAGFATAYAAAVALGPRGLVGAGFLKGLHELAAAWGLIAVFCSVMVYVATGRPFWNLTATSLKFFLTAAVLGLPTALLVTIVGAGVSDALLIPDIMARLGRPLLGALMVSATLKLLVEAMVLGHLRDRQQTALKRTARLLTGEFALVGLRRYFFGLFGGLLLPGLLLAERAISGPDGFRPIFVGVIVGLILVLMLLGELLERYVFFTASVAPKMPGAMAS